MRPPSKPFQVDATSLRPLTSQEYDFALTGRRNPTDIYFPSTDPYVPPAPNPCPTPAPCTDVISSETTSELATSQVDLDAWQNVATIQPLRWYPRVVREYGPPTPSRLVFGATDASGAAISLNILVTTDAPSAFETSGGLLILTDPHEPETRGTAWSSTSLTVSASLDGTTRLRVQLSNIVLEKDRLITEPLVTRTLSSASIVGEWIQQ